MLWVCRICSLLSKWESQTRIVWGGFSARPGPALKEGSNRHHMFYTNSSHESWFLNFTIIKVIRQILKYIKMGNTSNVTQAMKQVNQLITGGGGSGSDRDENNRLPDGEKYFGFVNVRVDPYLWSMGIVGLKHLLCELSDLSALSLQEIQEDGPGIQGPQEPSYKGVDPAGRWASCARAVRSLWVNG